MPSVTPATRRKSDKIWRDALQRALARAGGKEGVVGGLNSIADTVVGQALAGDQAAWKEIGDRLDGKAIQATAITDSEGNDVPVGVDVRIVSGTG